MPRRRRHPGLGAILAIVLGADIMDLLDSTIITIAAPTIAARLLGGPGLIKWLGASYALALGVLLVIGIGVASALAVPLLPRKPQGDQADAGH